MDSSRFTAFLCLPLLLFPSPMLAQPSVKTGADVMVESQIQMLRGKRVGVITNQTGKISTGESLVEALIAKNVTVTALFGPEHGIHGEAGAGESIGDTVDGKTGIPAYSLFGKTTKPTPEMLHAVDILVYDIQDVGARFYTYVSTMTLAMEAAAEQHIPFVVLDRPNPIAFIGVDGPIREDSLKSFVGMLPIPAVYGLTCGELATMVNNEGWLSRGVRCDLAVVRMEGWKRSMHWEETGLPWIPPSPNIPTPSTALIYPATCLFEATNLSEGRGTLRPFQTIGAPFVDSSFFASVSGMGIKGVQFSFVRFSPASSKFKGEFCNGLAIAVSDPLLYRPVRTSLLLIQALRKSYPAQIKINRRWFVRLLGVANIYNDVVENQSIEKIEKSWITSTASFRAKSKNYFLY